MIKYPIILLILSLITACSSMPSGTDYDKEALQKHFWIGPSQGWYTPNKSDLSSVLKEPTNKAIFRAYCHDGRQIRNLKIKLQATTSKEPVGLTLTEAGASIETKKRALRKAGTQIFFATTFGYFKDELWGGREELRLNQVKTNPGKYGGDSARLFISYHPSHAEYLKAVKNTELYCPIRGGNLQLHSDELRIIHSSQSKTQKGLVCRGPSFAFFNHQSPIVLSLTGFPTYIWSTEDKDLYPNSTGGTLVPTVDEGGSYKIDGSTPNYPIQLRAVQKQGFVFGGVGSEGLTSEYVAETKNEIFPVRTMKLVEGEIFKAYTMLIPKSEQERLFPDYFKLTQNQNHFFLEQDGSFNLNDATDTQQHEMLWLTYMNELTSIKEAQSSDPHVINYEVSLDLNPFCRFGRPIEDLKSK